MVSKYVGQHVHIKVNFLVGYPQADSGCYFALLAFKTTHIFITVFFLIFPGWGANLGSFCFCLFSLSVAGP